MNLDWLGNETDLVVKTRASHGKISEKTRSPNLPVYADMVTKEFIQEKLKGQMNTIYHLEKAAHHCDMTDCYEKGEFFCDFKVRLLSFWCLPILRKGCGKKLCLEHRRQLSISARCCKKAEKDVEKQTKDDSRLTQCQIEYEGSEWKQRSYKYVLFIFCPLLIIVVIILTLESR
jgi:hypothetical protein